MAKVTGFTAERMLEIERSSLISAAIEGADELIFYTKGGGRIRAGVIKGGTAEWIEEYKPIVDRSAEKVESLEAVFAELDVKVAEAVAEGEAAKNKAQSALDAAFAAQGGVAGALTNIQSLDTRLTADLATAQSAADGAVTELTTIFDDVLIKGSGGSIRLRDSTVTAPNIVASKALSAKVAQFLEVETGKITWDKAAGNQAFINSLVGEDAFLTNLLAKKVVVGDGTNLWWDQEYKGQPGSGWTRDGLAYRRAGTSEQVGDYPESASFPVMPGNQLWVSATRTNVSGSTGVATLSFQRSTDGGATWTSWTSLPMPSAGSPSRDLTVPSGTTHVRPGLYVEASMPTTTTVNISHIQIRHKTGSVLIEKGAVTADGLAADSITAKHTITGSTIIGAQIYGGMFEQNSATQGAPLRIENGTITAFKNVTNPDVGLPGYSGYKLHTLFSNESDSFHSFFKIFSGTDYAGATKGLNTIGNSISISPDDIEISSLDPNTLDKSVWLNVRGAHTDMSEGDTYQNYHSSWRDIVRTPRQGYWSVTSTSWLGTSPVFYATKTFTLPEPVPIGYRLMVYTHASSGYTFCDLGRVSGKTVNVRVMQLASDSTTALSAVGWAMIPTNLDDSQV